MSTGSSSPSIPRPAIAAATALWALAAVGTALLAVALVAGGIPGRDAILSLSDDPALVVGLIACVIAALGTRGRDRQVWTLLAIGLALWVVGEAIYEVRAYRGMSDDASVADLLYLGFYPFTLAALFLLGQGERVAHRQWRTLDVIIVMLGSGLIMWWMARDGALSASSDATTRLVDTAYAALDLGVLWLILLPAFHSDARWSRGRTLLASGFVLILAADMVWMTTHSDAYDLIAALAMLCIAATAVHHPLLSSGRDPELSRRHRWIGEAAVVGAGGAALAIGVWLALESGMPADMVVAAAAVLALVLARLTLTIVMNDRLLRESERRASTDPLTGLANHGAFHEQLGRELSRARRTGAPLGLLLIDLDRLKEVNDFAGHRTGDRVIRELAGKLRTWCRTPDVACRIGGDEFALLAPGTDADALAALAERLGRAAHAIEVDGLGEMSISVGGAVFPDTAQTAAEFVERADAALYEAKRGGRDDVRLAQPTPGVTPVVRLAEAARG